MPRAMKFGMNLLKQGIEKLFTTSDGQQALSLSLDGNYLVSSFVEAYPYGNNKTVVYNLAKRKSCRLLTRYAMQVLYILRMEKNILLALKLKDNLRV